MTARCTIALTLLLGCGRPLAVERQHEKRPWLLTDELRAAVAAHDETLRTARSSLLLANNVSVTDCAQYIDARRKGIGVSEEVNARFVSSEYLVCDVLSATTEARAVEQQLPGLRGRVLASRLDLRSFNSSLKPMLADDLSTLAALPGKLRATDTTVTLGLEGWIVSLQVVAEVDLTHDGKVDWLVWLADGSTESTYRDYRTLIVEDVAQNGPLHAAELWPALTAVDRSSHLSTARGCGCQQLPSIAIADRRGREARPSRSAMH